MQSQKLVVLDIEGFNHRKTGFVIKELAVRSNNYADIIHFLPPKEFQHLTDSEQRTHNWVTKFLNGLSWQDGELSYSFVSQILTSISLRHPRAKLFAKGKLKCAILTEYLQRAVENLEDLNCPKIDFLLNSNSTPCFRHSKNYPISQPRKHCAVLKSQLFFDWLTKNYDVTSGQCNSKIPIIAGFDSLCLGDRN